MQGQQPMMELYMEGTAKYLSILSYKLNVYATKLVLVSSGCLGSSKCPQSLQRHEGNREKFKSKENEIKLKDLTFINFSKI